MRGRLWVQAQKPAQARIGADLQRGPAAFATVRKTPKSSQGISPLLGSPG